MQSILWGFGFVGVLINLVGAVITAVAAYFIIRLAVKHAIIDATGDLQITIREGVKSALREYENAKENNKI